MALSFTKMFKKDQDVDTKPAALKQATMKPVSNKPADNGNQPKHNGEDVCCGSCQK
ncbi:CCGSCS motif protein [Shewanella gelidii]|uniref:CCGSCS motif protein n=1 Tax=Shewanella gelidii TaxID=1642821 RepID=A0A917N995_9GAMM|nr:CCGSCS motif protein [Shewanella gelidii]MCL1097659.1 CCGSCS motif protein [Shewanella gelidii]GGI79786.1 hypothetical protein GCM10009332_16480 [Shewanella gelidii]